MEKELSNEFKKIHLRLNETEQEVKLGSFDTTFLTIIIFIISLGLSINIFKSSIEFFKNNQYILVGLIYLFVLVIPLIYAIFSYPVSIFSSRGRFTIKINILMFLLGTILFIGLVWILLGIFWFLEQKNNIIISSTIVTIALFSIFGISLLLTFTYINRSIKKHFLNEFPNLFFKKIKQMSAVNRKKALKSFKITYQELKKKAGYQ